LPGAEHLKSTAMKTDLQHRIPIGISVGIITSFGLIGYFLIMHMLGLTHFIELRLFNFVILFTGVFIAIKRDAKHSYEYTDFRALGPGCLTALTAISIFSMFLYIFLVSDEGLMAEISKNSSVGNFLNPETASIGVFAEGMASGMIMAFVLLPFGKAWSDKVHDQKKG
jgi:hypothetical protein